MTPMLVLVGGPAGSGKSTLARLLADRMGLVHLSRDAVKSAIAATGAVVTATGVPVFDAGGARRGGAYGRRGYATAYSATRALLDGGASVVVDQAWTEPPARDQLGPLIAVSRAVLVVTRTSRVVADDRVRDRGRRSGLAPLDEVLGLSEAEWRAARDLDLALPRLVVDTTDGYAPTLDAVERWVWRETVARAT